jgi:hypothetical protein
LDTEDEVEVGFDKDFRRKRGMLVIKDEDTRDALRVVDTASEGAIVRVAEMLFKLVTRVRVVSL